MKKINKIKLSSLSNEDLNKREMNKLLGGENCCICYCHSSFTTSGSGLSLLVDDKIDYSGAYGAGAFA
ncbi:MAG: rSAM-modified peptide [Bacteroides sp.]|nr:rSAM-modified peptide [Bacteroides sp.]